MAESEQTKRPMRKLTVKNFSVIEDAELEFGKITVLIGPQSSGKSLLCKIAYFLGKELVELAVSSILDEKSWDEFLGEASKAFWRRFTPGFGLASGDSLLTFISHEYEVSVHWSADPNLPIYTFSSPFSEQYLALLVGLRATIPSASGAFIPGGLTSMSRREDVWVALHRILSPSQFDGAFYIPAERSFFTNAAKGSALLQNPGIDPILRDFSGQLLWDSRWKIGLLTSGRGITDEINRKMTDILGGFVLVDGGVPQFLASDGRKLPIEKTATGTQELAPLFDILEQVMYFREHTIETERSLEDPPRPRGSVTSRPFLYLEEPEAHIFPHTQYSLVQLFSWLANDAVLDFSWVITTHSPYLLSSFNNLLEAWQVAATKPNAKNEVAKLIEERYWIKPSDFRAYCIHDGKLESIMDEETGLINGSYLDGISNEIGSQFDALLRIGYVEA